MRVVELLLVGVLISGQVSGMSRADRQRRGQWNEAISRDAQEVLRLRRVADQSQSYQEMRREHDAIRQASRQQVAEDRLRSRTIEHGAPFGGFHANRAQQHAQGVHRAHHQNTHSNVRMQHSRQGRSVRPIHDGSQGEWPHFYQLIRTMKLYKTTNFNQFAGHVYEHSLWTAMTIHQWFEEGNAWRTDIDNSQQDLLVLAGLLHTIGKISQDADAYAVGFDSSFDTVLPRLDAYPYPIEDQDYAIDAFEVLRSGNHKKVPIITPESVYDATQINELLVRDRLSMLQSLEAHQLSTLTSYIFDYLSRDHSSRSGVRVAVQDIVNAFSFEGLSRLDLSVDQKQAIENILTDLISSCFKTFINEGSLRHRSLLDMRVVLGELGLDDQSRKLLAIVAGVTPHVENLINNFRAGSDQDAHYKSFLDQLSQLAYQAGYNNGEVTRELVCSALIVGAASVNARHVNGRSMNDDFELAYNDFRNSCKWVKHRPDLFETPREHGTPSEITSVRNVEHHGTDVRDAVINYLERLGGTCTNLSLQRVARADQLRAGAPSGQFYDRRHVRSQVRQSQGPSLPPQERRDSSNHELRRVHDSRVLRHRRFAS